MWLERRRDAKPHGVVGCVFISFVSGGSYHGVLQDHTPRPEHRGLSSLLGILSGVHQQQFATK